MRQIIHGLGIKVKNLVSVELRKTWQCNGELPKPSQNVLTQFMHISGKKSVLQIVNLSLCIKSFRPCCIYFLCICSSASSVFPLKDAESNRGSGLSILFLPLNSSMLRLPQRKKRKR